MKKLLRLRSRQCPLSVLLPFFYCSMLLFVSYKRRLLKCDTFTLLDRMECLFWLLVQMCSHHHVSMFSKYDSKYDSSRPYCTARFCIAAEQSPTPEQGRSEERRVG